MVKPAWFWGSTALITLLGFFVFPGHTYLAIDTQIYVPTMERIYNPVLFSADPMVSTPYLALTAYDEIAIALRNYAALDFERGLKLQQLMFRACAVAGLLLIALELGLPPPAAFFVAAIVSLNSETLGIGITELEPVARSFAFGLLLLAVALACTGRELAAGTAAALGFLYHPPTMAPFWCVAVFVVLLRKSRPILLAPLLPAVGILLFLMHNQAGGTEKLDFFRRLDPFQLDLQRTYMAGSFLSEWNTKKILDCLFEFTVVGALFWRLRNRLRPPLRDWLWGFGALALLAIPFSWIILEQIHWAMAAPLDPIRALVYATLIVALLSAAAGVFAAEKGWWWEAAVWFALALALPVKESLATWFADWRLVALVVSLTIATTAAGLLANRTRGLSLTAAAILPFIGYAILIPKPWSPDTPELRQIAEWARANTDETAVFLFPDDGLYGGSGPFRARALRSIYVDFEGRGLVNYFPKYSIEWMQRWRDVHEGHWILKADDFPDLGRRGIDFVVLRKRDAIEGKQPEFANSSYLVYRVLSTF